MNRHDLGDSHDASEGAQVRVEVLGGATDEMHFVGLEGTGPSQRRSIATLAASLALIALVIAGMWWAGRTEPSDQAVPETEQDRPAEVPQSTVLPDPLTELAFVGNGDLGARWLELPELGDAGNVVPTHVVRHGRDYVASSTESLDLFVSLDGVTWANIPSSLPQPDDTAEQSGIIGLFQRQAGYFAFVVTSMGETSSSEFTIYASDSPFGPWSARNKLTLDGHPRDVSFDGENFTAVVDNLAQGLFVPQMGTRLIRGSIASGELGNTQVAPNQFVSSHVPSDDGGVLATLTTFAITQATDPVRTVSKWTASSGWSAIRTSEPAPGQNAELIKSSSGIYLWDAGNLWPVSTDVSGDGNQAPFVALDTALYWVGDSFTSMSASAAPDAYMAVVPRPGDGVGLSITRDFESWFEVGLPGGSVLPELLFFDGSIALVRVITDTKPQLMIVPFSEPAAPTASRFFDVMRRDVADGEWAQPVLSAAPQELDGFVGLTNANGVVSSFFSSDGVERDVTYQTDLPFGYVINDMSVFDEGLTVKGKLGLIDDSIFTSDDAVAWKQLDVELPRDGGVLEIDSYDLAQGRVAIAGSLGWADDLSRTERALLYFDGSDWIDVDPRPCDEPVEPCTIISVRLVGIEGNLDVVMAQHQLNDRVAWSFWQDDEWAITVSTEQPVSEPIGLQRVGDELFALNDEVARIDYALQRTTTFAGPAPGIPGRYVALSPSGDAAVYVDEQQSRLWTARVRADGRWSWYDNTYGFRLDGYELDRVIAVDDSFALATATGAEGQVTLRFEVPGF